MVVKQKWEKIEKWVSRYGIWIVLVVLAIYYGIRMWTLDPWYDELYTYYSFISRGPIYAGIHWPVPNNHMGYSVAGGFLNYLGNSTIGLRGAAFLASLGNVYLIYRFAVYFWNNLLALISCLLFAGAFLINYLAIQGRGYSFATFWLLVSVHCLYQICVKEKEKLWLYCLFGFSFVIGLYTITSSVYWVLPVCFTGGLYLLLEKKYKSLGKLIFASVLAAVGTFFVYSMVWLAIGSNLLSKTVDSGYYGVYQVKIIVQKPFLALTTGMEYMLATPYIQSKDRGLVVRQFFDWSATLFQQFYSGLGLGLVLLFFLFGLLGIGIAVWSKKQNQKEGLFLGLFLAVFVFAYPCFMIGQSVQPYFRVLSFLAFVLAIGVTCGIAILNRKTQLPFLQGIFLILVCLLVIGKLASAGYRIPLADRESRIKEIWQEAGIKDRATSICYMDDYQKYVLKFFWDSEPEERYIGEAEFVLLPKEIEQKEYLAKDWPILYTYEEVDWDQLYHGYELIEESDSYKLFQKGN